MHGSIFNTPAFRPLPFALYLVVAAALAASWLIPGPVREWWDVVDVALFRFLNGSLPHAQWWQQLWAIGNSHFFDFLALLLMLWLVFGYIIGEERRHVPERIAIVVTIVATILVASVLTNIMDSGERPSPTATLEGAFMLSKHVTWLQTKDIAYNSYPSDHAAILLMMSLMLWHFAGRKAGLIMLAAGLFFTFPRVIGGAHWLTDIMAGSIPLSLSMVALCIYTPLHRHLVRGLMRLTHMPFFAACIEIGTSPETPKLVAKGCCMGAADIVPGVSGGTVAYILGVWHRLIEAIKSFDAEWLRLVFRLQWTAAIRKAHLGFIVPLAFGVALAVVTFTKFIPIPILIQTHPEPVYGLFFGLIAGSILILLGEMGKLTFKDTAILCIGTGLGWLLVNIVPVQTPESAWFIFLCGCVAISAMLLPGISGSFILLILGKYAYILEGLGNLDFAIILPFAAGCFVGLAGFSRGASWLLHHYYRLSVLIIIGILIGSLWMIWPFQERVYETVREKERLISSTPVWPDTLHFWGQAGIGLMAASFVIVLTLGWVASNQRQQRLHEQQVHNS